MITVNRYIEVEKFNRLWKLRNQGKMEIVYWAGVIYIFKKVKSKEEKV